MNYFSCIHQQRKHKESGVCGYSKSFKSSHNSYFNILGLTLSHQKLLLSKKKLGERAHQKNVLTSRSTANLLCLPGNSALQLSSQKGPSASSHRVSQVQVGDLRISYLTSAVFFFFFKPPSVAKSSPSQPHVNSFMLL